MSNGYLVAAEADLAAAHDIADGFGLDVIDPAAAADHAAVAAALAGAANVGLLLSQAAAETPAFTALLALLPARLGTPQLILIEPDVRAVFPDLPAQWPAMSIEEARRRSAELARRRDLQRAQAQPAPESPAGTGPPQRAEHTPPAPEQARSAPAPEQHDEAPPQAPEGPGEEWAPAEDQIAPPAPEPQDFVKAQPPPSAAPPPPDEEPPPPPHTVESLRQRTSAIEAARVSADATAFAPKKLRRGTPELVRIVVHQPKDLKAVIKSARQIDPRSEPAPRSMSVGDIALGAKVGVALDVRGAQCDGAVQRRAWSGDPIDFSFSVEPDADVKQVVILARVFVDDAQIGVLAFTRQVMKTRDNAAATGGGARLKRHKRVFLSYSSADRESVAAIATAYQMAGVAHFWDRTSLKSGEEWSPRLRREIERADLFHLCWSKAAARSEWVEREAEYALTRRRRSNGKRPSITVQMLDGPPWAPHPPHLDAINFDDFVRAAIVGYARGEG